MRLSAVIEEVDALTLHDHAGWAFDDPDQFRSRAGEFLAEGLSARQRILYVGGARTAEPIGIDGLDAAVAGGQAQITSVAEMYCAGEPVDPEQQVEVFAEAAKQALADGWTGLRVAADVTSLVLTDRQRAAWIRYEHLADAFMAREPVAGMCGFDRTALSPGSLAEIVCLHPVLNAASSDFRLYSAAATGSPLALAGEIDRDSRQMLATILRHTRPEPDAGRLTVDATALDFLDHHVLAAFAEYATELGVTAELRATYDSVAVMLARVAPMSGLEVRVVPS